MKDAKPIAADQPKKTRAQIAKERAEADRVQRDAEIKAWREALPQRMLALMAMARPVVHRIEIRGAKTGEAVKAADISGLKLHIDFDGGGDEEVISMSTESWQFDLIIKHVQDAIDARAAAEAKLRLARETYDNLNQAQRDALGLKYRP